MVRFAHLADCHIGAWREPKMRVLADRAFSEAVSACLSERVDFAVLAGDLFHTALPGIEHIRHVVRELQRLKEAGIPVYFVAGSHDYSPTGKTMLSVLEEAGLLVDVFRPTEDDAALRLDPVIDARTGVRLAGILGRAGQTDRHDYARLDRESLARLPGPKVFLFHAALRDLLPDRLASMEASDVSLLPPGFDYYAGGHVHIVSEKRIDGYGEVAYPGPVFPASFSELEDVTDPGLFIVELAGGGVTKRRVSARVADTFPIALDCAGLSPDEVEGRLRARLEETPSGAIVLARLSGQLSRGSVSDIDFRSLWRVAEDAGAYFCMRNTQALTAPRFEETDLPAGTTEEIEDRVIAEHVGQVPLADLGGPEERELFRTLLSVLGKSPQDGETKKVFEDRVTEEGLSVLAKQE